MPSDPEIALTRGEMILAATIGTQRQIENLFAKRPDAHGAPKEVGWQIHVEGAAGEIAFAKWANRFWSGALGDLKADDVGKVQIRTRSRHDYDLILHKGDPDDRVFVLVTGLAPHFRLRGWIWAVDGKRAEFWRDPAGGRPAYFVPASALRPMRLREGRLGAGAVKTEALEGADPSG